MEDGGTVTSSSAAGSDTTSEKMVAPSTSNAARRAMLNERKKNIEALLAKNHQDLKRLCIQEAELTGIIPEEMPVEIGEIPPIIRRKMGTAYQLNEKLLNMSIKESSRDQLIADLELKIQVHINMMNAALGLSMEGNISKTVKRQHAKEYMKYKEQVKHLEEQLIQLKEKAALEVKQKKKSRVPEPQDDSVSIHEPEQRPVHPPLEQHFNQVRHPHLTRLSPAETYPDDRYQNNSHVPHRSRENHTMPNSLFPRPELVNPGFFQLGGNDLNNYLGRHDNMSQISYRGSLQLPQSVASYTEQYYTQPGNRHMPGPGRPILARNQYASYYNEPNQSQDYRLNANSEAYSPTVSHSGLVSRQSCIPQHGPLMQTCNPSLTPTPRYNRVSQSSAIDIGPTKMLPLYPHPENIQRPKVHYPHYQVDEGLTDYRNSRSNPIEPTLIATRNTNAVDRHANLVTIQPHQQYENNGMSDIHGRLEACSIAGSVWTSQCDKRFGSLDRRRAITKKEVFDEVSTQARSDEENGFRKPVLQPLKRIDGRALVRTQSLGSVGLNTENVYHPSDDTVSSCDGEGRPRPILKRKEKNWMETSLDGPVDEYQPLSRSQSTVPSTLIPDHFFSPMAPSPEYSADSPYFPNDKFLSNNYGFSHSPVSPKPPLEIPAESNPSPRISEQANIEMLNNNIPKNCMMVQQCIIKPYHEETKPFEMSDFYKYSTKFKKSPQKEAVERACNLSQSPRGSACSRNLTSSWQTSQNMVLDSPTDSMILDSHRIIGNLNVSEDQLECGQCDSNVSQRYPGDINNWLQHQENNNRPNQAGNRSGSNATLV